MWYFTGKGDQGDSSLYDGRQISKGDIVLELIGTLDEATAHLGLAISFCEISELSADLRGIQVQLSKLMGLLAGREELEPDEKTFPIGATDWLEDKINIYGKPISKPHAFLFSGQSTFGAVIDVSRTVIRRAERIAVRFFESDDYRNKDILSYLNRLSSFLYILRLYIEFSIK